VAADGTARSAAALIVAASATFVVVVVGVALERSGETDHHETRRVGRDPLGLKRSLEHRAQKVEHLAGRDGPAPAASRSACHC
jgi:hypothetical protein